MGEICLSVAPNLRCQSLTRTEAGILLIPPGLEIIFAIVLLWTKRGADKKHVFIAAEVFIYFLLAVIDVFTHTLSTIGMSLDSFKALDIIIGVASFIPLFLYTFSLYLLTTAELIPSLPVRFQNITKYVLLAFIPLIVVLNELGSFIGITYRQFGGGSTPVVLGVGFSDPTPEMFLSSVTLVLLTAFQAANFCIAFYRLVRALSHQRTLDASQQEKEMEAHLFRGLGWIVAGMKLGAIETVIGFAQGGFGIAFTRRLLRLLAHACLVIGIIKGVDTVEDFQLYSPGEVRKRRKSTIRAMIQNPRFSTFRHVGGHDFEKSPFDERRQSVVKLGSPSWMRRDFVKPTPIVEEEERYTPGLLSARKSTSLTFMLTPRPTFRRTGGSNRGSASSYGSAKRSPWTDGKGAIDEYADVQKDADEVDLSDLPAPVPRVGLPPRPVRQRVTVHMRKDRLPVLELHRLSNLSFSDFMRDPFRDQHIRARSLPDALERSEDVSMSHIVSASFTRLPAYAGVSAPAIPPPVFQVPMRQSTASRYSRTASFASYDRPLSGMPGGDAHESRMPSFNQHLSYATTDFNPHGSSLPNFHQQLNTAITDFDPRASTAGWSYSGSQSPSAMSFHAIGSPTTSTFMDLERSRSTKPPTNRLRINPSPDRPDRGVSSSTTASDVHALALQFPGIPPRHFSQPTRRSVLSQEISRAEFVVDPDEPMPSPPHETETPTEIETETSEPTVSRTSSGNRKSPPAPLRTTGLMDARVANVEIEQDVDDMEDAAAMRSLPTPLSAPRYASVRARAHSHSHSHSHSASHVADVPVSAMLDDDDGSFDSGFREVPVVRSASLVRRGSEQERKWKGKLVRVKSVGQAPIRSVWSSAREQSMARDSIMVELGMIAREGQADVRYDPVADTQV